MLKIYYLKKIFTKKNAKKIVLLLKRTCKSTFINNIWTKNYSYMEHVKMFKEMLSLKTLNEKVI